MKKKVNRDYLFLGGVIVVFFLLWIISIFSSPTIVETNDIPSVTVPSVARNLPPCEQYGLQGVEFCGQCYNCGEVDGVCPRLFGVDCSDPDCEVQV